VTPNIDQQVDAIFRSLDDMSPSALELFAAALRLADDPPAWFAAPVRRWAGDRAAGDAAPNPLTQLSMRQTITKAATERTLIARLEDADEGFWRGVADALVVVAGARLPVDA
jgi:hypothetical protein